MCESVLHRIEKGAKVGFFGLGKSNLSLLSNLTLDKCRITLRSDKPIRRENISRGERIERIFDSSHACDIIDEDILVFSPSVRRERPQLEVARQHGVIFTCDLDLFLEKNEKPLFAVSGSDGKSTTATLANLLLGSSLLIGNIGTPMTASLGKECSAYVAEISSFMLEYTNVPAHRACITNITKNHLDWHRSFEEYIEAKLSLLRAAQECVINADDEICAEFAKKNGAFGIVSEKQTFGELKDTAKVILTRSERGILKNGELLVPYSDIRCKESHNIKNLMMAIALTDRHTNEERICEVASSFSGLPHRCEKFLEKDGIEYINSSIDSSPARTVATLRSLNKRVILLLGGRSKGLDYGELCNTVREYAERALIFGESREEIYSAIKNSTKCELLDNIEEAAERALELSMSAEAVILSPASTSYDAFSSFEERGNYFKKMILNSINRT